jgi:excisionase family DNA binding protein
VAEQRHLDLDALLGDTARAIEVPVDRVPALQAAAAAEQAKLAAVQSALAARLAAASALTTSAAGRFLTVDEAAGRTGMSRDWFYRHAKTLPCTRRIGRKLLFDEGAFNRWLAARPR